jgi:predicted transcriptional regulator
MKNIQDILTSIGLSKQEARAYLGLHTAGESQSGKLAQTCKIATANLYPVLKNLVEKGLVSYRVKNNIKIFMANPPETLTEFVEAQQAQLDKRREELQQAIPALKKAATQIEHPSNFKYYEGISGVKAMWFELQEGLHILDKTEIVKIHSSRKGTFEHLLGFYDDFHSSRIRAGIKYRLILTTEAKGHGQKRQVQNAQVKYLPLRNQVQWGVVGDRFFMYYSVGKMPRSFLVIDPLFARSFECFFDELWARTP